MKRFVLYLLIIISFIIPYLIETWWRFIPCSVLIIYFASKLEPTSYKEFLGLKAAKITILKTLIVFGLMFFVSYYAINYQLQTQKLEFYLASFNPLWLLITTFHVLNEELIFRSILLNTIRKRAKNLFLVSLIVAVIFSLAHLVHYFISDGTILKPLTLIVLFIFGLACNHLFFKYKHIWYCYAIHLSWNITRFKSELIHDKTQIKQGQTFNLIEGSYFMLVFALIILFLILLPKNKEFWKNFKLKSLRSIFKYA